MYGAIFGDYVGSVYEFDNIKTKEFDLIAPDAEITDDSFMTIAVASACLDYAQHRCMGMFTHDVEREMRRIGQLYPFPKGGYGSRFKRRLMSRNPRPYHSWGNGSAMRVSPCGWAAESLMEAELLAQASAMPTHDHPEGILGTQATAGAVYLARTGKDKEEILDYLRQFYPMDKTLDEIRPTYRFHSSCRGTVPMAIQAFLESTDYEDAIRNAVSLGGDTDTLCAITGAVAEAFYGFPQEYLPQLKSHLEAFCEPREQEIIRRFRERFCQADSSSVRIVKDEEKTPEVNWDDILPLGPIPELMVMKLTGGVPDPKGGKKTESKTFVEKIEKLSFGNDEFLTPEDEELLNGLPPIEFPWGKTLLPPERKE